MVKYNVVTYRANGCNYRVYCDSYEHIERSGMPGFRIYGMYTEMTSPFYECDDKGVVQGHKSIRSYKRQTDVVEVAAHDFMMLMHVYREESDSNCYENGFMHKHWELADQESDASECLANAEAEAFRTQAVIDAKPKGFVEIILSILGRK